MIKALFFDIDGTLVSYQTHTVNPSVFKAFALARERGILLFAATGRNLTAQQEGSVLEQLPAFDGFITMNGAYCYANGTVAYKQPLHKNDVAAMVALAQRGVFSCKFAELDRYYTNSHSETLLEYQNQLGIRSPEILDISRALQNDVYSITPYVKEQQEHLFINALQHSEITRWHPLIADIVPKGCGKHTGMAAFGRLFGFALEQTAAFGDGENDLSMIHAAKIGVAMQSGSDRLKQAADHIAVPPEQDGVYRALLDLGIL